MSSGRSVSGGRGKRSSVMVSLLKSRADRSVDGTGFNRVASFWAAREAAQAAGANGVILLSDVDGLYTANPATNPTAQRLSVVKSLTPSTALGRRAASASGDWA